MFEARSMKVLDKIGEGLSSEVFRVRIKNRALELDQDFALKLLKTESDINLFKKEFSNLSKALGKRLPRLYGWKKWNNRYGLIMDLVEGVELCCLCDSVGLNSQEIEYVLNEINQGLLELKNVGLFHGDLSPKNVLIDTDGGIKLVDFGLTLWKTQRLDLTPQFASPLILKGGSPSYKTDLDSLELMSNYLLTHQSNERASDPMSSLSRKVRSIKSATSLKTRALTLDTKSNLIQGSRKPRVCDYIMALGLLILLAFPVDLSTGLLSSKVTLRHSELGWAAFKLVGKTDWCFSPCGFSVDSVANLKIEWKTSEAVGYHKLRLEPGENKVFDLHDHTP